MIEKDHPADENIEFSKQKSQQVNSASQNMAPAAQQAVKSLSIAANGQARPKVS